MTELYAGPNYIQCTGCISVITIVYVCAQSHFPNLCPSQFFLATLSIKETLVYVYVSHLFNIKKKHLKNETCMRHANPLMGLAVNKEMQNF